ncbi:MAG: HU family DNA-binding protein [Desulfobacterota bacterium]|nr:HU family DNA-binding protein [Thermodesulfobacteriota bacterium]
MTKADFIAAVGKEANVSKATAEKVINASTAVLTKLLKKGDRLSLPGFGTFSVTKRKARLGRNPQTGKEIKIPAVKVPKFKPGNILRKAVK